MDQVLPFVPLAVLAAIVIFFLVRKSRRENRVQPPPLEEMADYVFGSWRAWKIFETAFYNDEVKEMYSPIEGCVAVGLDANEKIVRVGRVSLFEFEDTGGEDLFIVLCLDEGLPVWLALTARPQGVDHFVWADWPEPEPPPGPTPLFPS